MDRIALIAGNGNFPLIFAQAAKNAGNYVVAIAIKEETDKNLGDFVDKIYWISVGELKTMIELLQKERVNKAIMAGQIRHKLLFSNVELDEELKMLFMRLKDKKTDTILSAVAARIEQIGVELIDSTSYIKDHLVRKGLLTKSVPTQEQSKDIEFGFPIAKAIAGLDIGQTIVVKNNVVLSVEAIEGTDEAISRANIYCNGGAVVVKVSKPNQDMRFDIPLIGKKTIETLIREKVAVLAIEAGKTLLLDKEYVLSNAEKNGICIIGI